MYVHITERCNMSCAHCCVSATADGRDMDRDTFVAACRWAEEYGDEIAIGGGEPTLHPLFWDYLGIALAATAVGECGVFVATNGSRTRDSIALANLARRGVLTAALSRDRYHDEIDPAVVDAFERGRPKAGYFAERGHDYREVRDVTNGGDRKPWAFGRALSWGEVGCVCPGFVVGVDGDVWGCEHREYHMGNVRSEVVVPDWWEHHECERDQSDPEEGPDWE
jgi:hypothetical protein